MNLTKSEILAGGRHVASYAAGIATALGAFHVLSSSDTATAIAAVNEISDGVGKLFLIASPIIALVSGWFASKSASPTSQIQAINQGDNGVKVVAATTVAQPVNAPLK